MNRDGFQRLAISRLADARALLRTKRWSGAYYVAGYAVECGLKSCVLARVASTPELLFDDRRFSEKCWTHNLEELLRLAGIRADFDLASTADVDLYDNWAIVKDWRETSRYVNEPKSRAQDLYKAIADKKHGVFAWVRARW